MDRAQKAEQVEVLNGYIASAGTVIVTHYSGMTVAEMSSLRAQMREAGAAFKVVKNRLVKRALEGTPMTQLSDFLTGPTAIAFSEDPVAPARVVVKYAKDNEKLVILGGMMGETVLDPSGVKALADLPSLDELRAKIAGMVNQPATKVAQVLQAPAGQLARVFGAYADKGEAA